MSTAKPANLWIIHKILMLFVIINIIGDVGNVIACWEVPSMPGLSLYNSYVGTAVGNDSITLLSAALFYSSLQLHMPYRSKGY